MLESKAKPRPTTPTPRSYAARRRRSPSTFGSTPSISTTRTDVPTTSLRGSTTWSIGVSPRWISARSDGSIAGEEVRRPYWNGPARTSASARSARPGM